MLFNPHKLGMHKVLKHIPLAAVFDAPYKAALKKAVNIADLRLIAKSRAHKVGFYNACLVGYAWPDYVDDMLTPDCCCILSLHRLSH